MRKMTIAIIALAAAAVLGQILITQTAHDPLGTRYTKHTAPATDSQQNKETIQDAAWTTFVLGGITFYALLSRIIISFIKDIKEDEE